MLSAAAEWSRFFPAVAWQRFLCTAAEGQGGVLRGPAVPWPCPCPHLAPPLARSCAEVFPLGSVSLSPAGEKKISLEEKQPLLAVEPCSTYVSSEAAVHKVQIYFRCQGSTKYTKIFLTELSFGRGREGRTSCASFW